MSRDTEFDLVLWGATGFTGQLTARFLLEHYGAEGELRWALGGRSSKKLEAVRSEIGEQTGLAADALPLVVGDAADARFLEQLVERARVVCTTVGPYAKYGSELVAACARNGAHYCDLTGEAQWMRRMIDAHQEEAERSGARIVHTCGFDSIPSDLGTFFIQQEMKRTQGVPCHHVKYRVKSFSGGFSGGTLASLMNVMAEAAADPEVRRILADPYALNPEGERSGPDGPDLAGVAWDEDFGSWLAPFVMAAINTRVVRRTNALLDNPYGPDFRYDEATLTGAGPLGLAKAAALTAGMATAMAASAVGPLRDALGRFLPSPGEGPSPEQQEKGYFDIQLHGAHPHDPEKGLRARVTGDRDPGYGSTSKMLAEAAVCLARDDLQVGGGFWTPASAMGEPLLERLQQRSGLTFSIED